MNVPTINTHPSANGYQYWYQHLSEGMVHVSTATFVSILISGKAIHKCGLPCKDFFIWGDDTEYTTRLTTFYGEAYLVGKSVATHKRVNAKAISLVQYCVNNQVKLYRQWYTLISPFKRICRNIILFYETQDTFFQLLHRLIAFPF